MSTSSWDADQRFLFEERAAIMQYCGGLPREEAERRARKIVDGRAAEPEQLDLGPGFDGYQAWKNRMGW